MTTSNRLEQIYKEVTDVILTKQNPVTGLLPASTSINTHGDYTDAWVRDNVYSIIAPWVLSLAFKRQGDTVRQDELHQATIKLMRGLLQAMLRQSDKVETFKHTLDPLDALHAKYDTRTGLTVVADDAWGHLQIDATSIFLLMLAQMTKSGLRIIKTYDEVDFIQNLVYYIASAYRCPDYGIWERGNKINNGKTEINASSVGMAKAALQALDGLNLFGDNASHRAVVHSLPDSMSLARNSLASLLPRESLSKEVDSALLSIIGFPAFAIGNEELNYKTYREITEKLEGNYGCKRFLWDGHQTELEDPNRLHYQHSELANFEHIESEWPLFFSYLYINALFDDNKEKAAYYRSKLEAIMVDIDGVKLIPELYYLPEENIAAEKLNPGSQSRVPNENVPLVWAQSIYYSALLIDEGYVKTDEIDSLNLRGNTTSDTMAQVALVVLAENQEVKKQLAQNGVIAEAIDDIAPVKVISAPHLVEAYAQVGANQALALSGRPRRRLQSLATSQTYDINDQKCLCLSWIQSEEGDYRMRDADLVAFKVRKEIKHLRKHWVNSEAAVFTFMVTQELCNSTSINTLYDTLKNFQLRTKDEHVGYASASLAYRAARENKLYIPNICLNPMSSKSGLYKEEVIPEHLEDIIPHDKASQKQAYYDIIALKDSATSKQTYLEDIGFLYKHAQHHGHWLIARLCFSLLNKTHTDLSDYLSVLSARHFSIIVGSEKNSEFSINQSLNNKEIVDTLKQISSGPVEYCLLQEVLASIGVLQRINPRIFEGLRSIQLHDLLKLCSEKTDNWTTESEFEVGMLSPARIITKIESILKSQHSIFTQGLQEYSPHVDTNNAMGTDWFEWRVERGLIVNLDRNFLQAIWKSLAHADYLVFGDSASQECVIDCDVTRRSMTSGEEIFAQLIDDSIQTLHPAYYKSAIVEALLAFTKFCEKHPDTFFKNHLNLSEQLENAAKQFCENSQQCSPSSRNIDILLLESPEVLQHYMELAFQQTTQKT